MKEQEFGFKEQQRVHKEGKNGAIIRISDKAIHVRYDNDFYEKFHFNHTHHNQTPITYLKKVN